MLIEIIKMAFESLLAKKIRSILSMLGIIIGVSTVIAVFAIGQGAQQAVNAQFEGLSAKTIMVMSMRGRGSTSSTKLAVGDAKILKDKGQHIELATGAIQGNASVSYGSTSASLSVIGSDLDYYKISNLELSAGRLITEDELSNNDKVAILGNGATETLFPEGQNPLGAVVTIAGKKVEIVGVFKEVGSSMGPMRVDDSVFMPYTTAQKTILGNGGSVMLNIQADSVDNVELATEELTNILREEHKLKESQENDFRVMDAGSMVGAAQESAQLMSILLTLIAAITLLVSGIGIMNVMFVTVAERTKEIGIAKAIGGKQGDILSQFLLESVILSTVGGIIGIIIGQAAIPIISSFNLMTLASSVTGPLLGFSFSVLVGVFFGFYPAFKASRLDPVDALRSE
ncbi:MAG: ABC transporter permease [Patescibacteria group bacterium]|jgi:putative ABC transport system permease protein